MLHGVRLGKPLGTVLRHHAGAPVQRDRRLKGQRPASTSPLRRSLDGSVWSLSYANGAQQHQAALLQHSSFM